jgi:hypothetical protein
MTHGVRTGGRWRSLRVFSRLRNCLGSLSKNFQSQVLGHMLQVGRPNRVQQLVVLVVLEQMIISTNLLRSLLLRQQAVKNQMVEVLTGLLHRAI